MEIQGTDDAKWYKAAFIVSGDSFEPEEISGQLGLRPTSSGRKGEIFSLSLLKRPLWNCVWVLDSPLPQENDLQDHLQWLLDQLESKPEAVETIAKKFAAEFFCGFASDNGQGQCILDSSLLARIGKLGIRLVLDLYPPGPIPN